MKRYTILIPFHNPWQWHYDYPNQTATLLARTHTVVCFLWGDAVSLWELVTGRKTFIPVSRSGNLIKLQPLFLIPGKRLTVPQCINVLLNGIWARQYVRALAGRERREALFWFFGWFDHVFLLLTPLYGNWKTVYDCVDTASSPIPWVSRLLKRRETELILRAILVFTNSGTLARLLKRVRQDVHELPAGFRKEIFSRPEPAGVPRTKKPTVLYLGSMDYRVDWTLLGRVVGTHPGYRFLIFGPVFHDHLSQSDILRMQRVLTAKNVIHGNVTPDRVPSLIAVSDVAIVPYDLRSEMARYANPLKVMEYFYGMKPVVATPVEELKRYPHLIRFARTPREWSRALRDALRRPLPERMLREERRIAEKNSFTEKIDEAERILSAHAGSDAVPVSHP